VKSVYAVILSELATYIPFGNIIPPSQLNSYNLLSGRSTSHRVVPQELADCAVVPLAPLVTPVSPTKAADVVGK
jgi:hypothetical protein